MMLLVRLLSSAKLRALLGLAPLRTLPLSGSAHTNKNKKPQLSGESGALSFIMPTKIERELSLPDPSCRWYGAYTKPCHEKRVAEHLEIRNIELFLPLYQSSRRWNNGCKVTLERPLFPGYVFVHIAPNERVRVLELSGVVSIVGTTREPTPLPDEDIERLRSGLHLVHAEPHPTLTMGETVRICRGPLEGMTGVVTRQKNSFRVVLAVELIMKSVAVEVSASDVEPIRQPAPAACQEMAFSAAN
jgi:transcription antitermination factor NusG